MKENLHDHEVYLVTGADFGVFSVYGNNCRHLGHPAREKAMTVPPREFFPMVSRQNSTWTSPGVALLVSMGMFCNFFGNLLVELEFFLVLWVSFHVT